jgi:hypothetical protein
MDRSRPDPATTRGMSGPSKRRPAVCSNFTGGVLWDGSLGSSVNVATRPGTTCPTGTIVAAVSAGWASGSIQGPFAD